MTSSETDAATTTETGTETMADELSDGPSQTASYSVTTTMPDSASDWETGTETLGGGGTISTGTASFSWSVGDSLNRRLTVSGIAAILSITENSTDTYGFGESGTETITTGGADAPGTVSFLWNQMGTDYYQINQANNWTQTSAGVPESKIYVLGFTHTVSSSWHDSGVDSLSASDVGAGETDTYSWSDLNSVTDSVTELDIRTYTYDCDTYSDTLIGTALESFSINDVGCHTLMRIRTPRLGFFRQLHDPGFSLRRIHARVRLYWPSRRGLYDFTQSGYGKEGTDTAFPTPDMTACQAPSRSRATRTPTTTYST